MSFTILKTPGAAFAILMGALGLSGCSSPDDAAGTQLLQSAGGYLEVGDQARGRVTCEKLNGLTDEYEILVRVTRVSQDGRSAWVSSRKIPAAGGGMRTSERGRGRDRNERDETVRRMDQSSLQVFQVGANLADQCTQMGGVMEVVNVSAGRLESCRISRGPNTQWLSPIPFSLVRSVERNIDECRSKQFELLSYAKNGAYYR